MTCWGDNVLSLRIDGTFDDCQRMVKEAFSDPDLSQRHRFSSANSINVGRLLPQMVYYIASSLDISLRTGTNPSYIVPAGNLGNALAAVWARAMGFPIARIILAHNINRTVPDFLETGKWQPRPEHSDAGLRHGCRQPQQHGADSCAVSDIGMQSANN